jgi:LL-diaminopimelate aminotransferase
MQAAKRILEINSPSFSELFEAKKAYTQKTGQSVIDFSIGSSDIPPMEKIKQTLADAAMEDASYQYSLAAMPEMVEAIQAWYHKRYGVDLEENEITIVKGSQEALSHVPLALCDPEDIVLIPDPYYPIYGTAPKLAGAEVVYMPLLEENNYLIDFDAIDEQTAKKAKLMYVSYPNNPTGKKAPDAFYENLIAFAKKYDIIVLHDNAYSELVFEGEPGKSFLAFEGAKEVGFELNSFSKSYSMGGSRLAVMVGNHEVIDAYKKLINMIDFQAFSAVQKAGITALKEGDGFVKEVRQEYKRRRDYLIDQFEKAGWHIEKPEATMFVWAKIPEWYSDSQTFLFDLLDQAGVLVNAGSSFGSQGARYVRLALVRNDQEVEEAAKRILQSKIMEKPSN